MHFIPRVDEILVPAPYVLDSIQLPFQSNIFILPAKQAKLQALVDEQLNAAMPKGPFRYSVPQSVQRVFLAFYRYDQVQSMPDPQAGWLGYSEAMIGFLVLRSPHPDLAADDPMTHKPPELVTYLGVVYIGNADYAKPISEPFTIPIVLGRSCYGLPKNPGRVFYEPIGPHQPNGPKVDIWDAPAGGGDLFPNTAIRISPIQPSSLQARPLDLPPSSDRPRDRVPLPPTLVDRMRLSQARLQRAQEDLRGADRRLSAREQRVLQTPLEAETEGERTQDWTLFAELLGVPGKLEVRAEVGGLEDPAVEVFLPEEDVYAIAWANLLWRTKLVGLKEFPDPQQSSTNGFDMACYQAIVESPLEETPLHLLGGIKFLYQDQRVDFPVVNRVDLLSKFGIIPTTGRSVHVGTDSMFYQEGSLLFADPSKVNVWYANP